MCHKVDVYQSVPQALDWLLQCSSQHLEFGGVGQLHHFARSLTGILNALASNATEGFSDITVLDRS